MTPDELKQWRKHQGLTQERLAQLLGVDVMTISRYERDKRKKIPPFLHLALKYLETQVPAERSASSRSQ